MAGIPPKSTPMVDHPWDGPANVARLPNPVGRAKARQMYAWVDSTGNQNVKASYHFPHHDVSDSGEVGPANIAGVRIGLARIPLAHIPNGERAGARAHLQRHLDDWHKKQGAATSGASTVMGVSEGSDMTEITTASNGEAQFTLSDYSGIVPLLNQAGQTIGFVAAEQQAPEAAQTGEKPWSGILAVVGSPTSDKRFLIPGEISNRDLPIPLRVQIVSGNGHDGAQSVGHIDQIDQIPLSQFDQKDEYNLDGVDPNAIIVFGSGMLDGSPASVEAERLIKNGAGVSIDLPPDREAIIDANTFEEVAPEDADPLAAMQGKYLHGVGGKIAAVTIVDIPAFEEAEIEPIEENSVLVASAYGQEVGDGAGYENLDQWAKAMIASAAPLKPNADWFTDPELKKLTPLTITPEGRVYGHLADWDGCHTGFSNVCVPPFRSQTDYAYFNTGEIECDDGTLVSVGKLMFSMDGGTHADTWKSAQEASQHYDDSTKVGAFVRAGTDRYGTWLAGALRPSLSDEEIQHLRSHPPSGDWRPIQGKGTELVAAFCVAVGGFPIPRAMVASGEHGELTIISAPLDLELGPHAVRRRFEVLKRKRKTMRSEADMPVEAPEEVIDQVELVVERLAQGLDMPKEMLTGVEYDFVEMVEKGLVELEWEELRDFPSATRRRMAKAGSAMPDGSFPIANCSDAANARQAIGRAAPGKRSAVRAHIAKREKALGCSNA